MKPPRQDKEPVGLGASAIVAVVGVVVAGVGLMSMRSAFPPLPRAETPVVLTHADRPLVSTAYHAPASGPAALVRPDEIAVDASGPSAPKPERTKAIRTREHRQARQAHRRDPAQVSVPPAPPPAEAPQKVAALAGGDDGKLCKAPSPNEVTAKAMQPGLILRYDTKFKSALIDIPPPSPPEDDRRLKLSAFLADILDN